MARLQVLPLPTPQGEAPRFVIVADEVGSDDVEVNTFAEPAVRVVPSGAAVEFDARLMTLGAQVGAVATVSFAEHVDVVG